MGKKRFECRNCAQQWKERREKRLAKEMKSEATNKARKKALKAQADSAVPFNIGGAKAPL